MLFLAVLLLAWINATTDAHARLNQEQERALRAGQVLATATPAPGGSAGRVSAIIDIPVLPKLLWNVMVDCQRAPKYLASLQSCTVLERAKDGSWDLREHRIKWLWILPEVKSVFRSQYTHPKSIRFNRTSGTFRKLMGRWDLQPLPNGRGTRLYYQATIDPGLPLLPGGVVRSAILKDLPKTLKALRAEAVAARSNP